MSTLLGNIKGQTGDTGATGATGSQGDAGLSVVSAEVNASFDLIITMSDSSTINAGYVKGADGSAITSVVTNTLSAGSNATASFVGNTLTLGIPVGDTGVQGIQGAIGNTGATGSQGISITSGAIDASYNLILTLSDSSTINAGYVRGATGADATLLDGDVNGGTWI